MVAKAARKKLPAVNQWCLYIVDFGCFRGKAYPGLINPIHPTSNDKGTESIRNLWALSFPNDPLRFSFGSHGASPHATAVERRAQVVVLRLQSFGLLFQLQETLLDL